MGLEFLKRVRTMSILAGLVLFPVIATRLGMHVGAAWLTGIAWSLINIHFIGVLVRATTSDPRKHRVRVAIIFLIKFPALYTLGFLCLRSGWFPPAALLAGFIWPIFVITMKAMGRLILRMDKPAELHYTEHTDLAGTDSSLKG